MSEAGETGKDKVKKICEVLRKETLEPAMREAERLIAEAQIHADEIIKQAESKSSRLLSEADREMERRKVIFEASLEQGARQAIETLKQDIEDRLLNKTLSHLLASKLNEPNVLSDLITAVVKAINKEGLEADLSAYIPAQVPARAVNELLAKEILEKLREKGVLAGALKGGAEIKLHKDKITVDISENALREMVANYVRKDLRSFLFGNS